MTDLADAEKRALEDIRRNNGVMWEPESGYEAEMLWNALIRKGAVRFNQWTERYEPNDR